MWRKLTAIVAIFAVGVLAWEFVPIQVTVWDGDFALTVRIESPDGQPKAVSCKAFSSREGAEEAIAYLPPPKSPMWSAIAAPYDGQPIKVRVEISGRESPFGRELRPFQCRFLAVTAVLADGRQVGKVVEIPDRHVSREVSVSFP
jgi:hypothetical protein